jgi:adenylate cyclase
MARDLGASAKNPLLTNDDLTLNLLVKDAMRDEDVAYVIFADQEQKILAHADVTQIGKSLDRPKGLLPVADKLLVQQYQNSTQANLIDFAVPLEFSNVRLGSLYLGFSDRSIRRTLARARNQTFFITFAMLLVGVGGATGLSLILSRPILRLVEGTKAIAEGNYQVSLAVSSRDEIGDLTASFNQMARSLREKEMIKQAFTRYVAREVVDEILKNPEQISLTGERREVSVLFCDLRGFTTLSERLPPEEVVALLNEFYTLMIETVFKHEGTLDKFLGDAVMAVFGAPIAHKDHSVRAVRTAVAMKAGIEQLSRKRVDDGKDPISVGIGVSAGEAVAGTVGTENRMEYTVIGDRVNLAARLEANAKPGQILISQWTYENVGQLVTARSLGYFKVKGKEEDVEVYEVLGLKEQNP